MGDDRVAKVSKNMKKLLFATEALAGITPKSHNVSTNKTLLIFAS